MRSRHFTGRVIAPSLLGGGTGRVYKKYFGCVVWVGVGMGRGGEDGVGEGWGRGGKVVGRVGKVGVGGEGRGDGWGGRVRRGGGEGGEGRGGLGGEGGQSSGYLCRHLHE